MEQQGALLLQRQLKEISKMNPETTGFFAGLAENDVYEWTATIIGQPKTLYDGGYLPLTMSFPKEYPVKPPVVKFTCDMWHPNIHKDGTVCISILHAPEKDEYGYEKESERWSPVQTVETIILSIMALLSDPNDESPANVDAAIQFRNDRNEYQRKVKRLVRGD